VIRISFAGGIWWARRMIFIRRCGVQEVDYIVLEGDVREQLRQFAIDTKADLMVMGTPLPGPGKNIFKQEELRQLISEME
jgi:nucleotide-binding universal stress UspA family protein